MAKTPSPNNASINYDKSDLPDALTDYPNYNEIIDSTTTAGFTYFCRAAIGTPEATAGWQVSRMEGATGKIMWADANAKFDNIASNRASLTYTFS